ncbi:hypothetical protein [Marinicella rhabdoformis]|uniref:hypothetical protein n=1 Tax=Marinicella rhabdoformis TaxID=2580566 RepID=UPI0012AECB89|nr:hypothetical protein [Marinicella rhabdoformis]
MNTTANTLTQDQKCQFLYAALKEAQDNIRTYDTKAQIVGIGFIFTIGMATRFNTWSQIPTEWQLWTTLFTWVLIIVPAILFGAVLYPTRRFAPSVLRNKDLVKGMFYMNEVESVADYVGQLNDMNTEQELSYELLKVSYLRDLKRRHFLNALTAATTSLFLLFVLQIVPTLT